MSAMLFFSLNKGNVFIFLFTTYLSIHLFTNLSTIAKI